MRRKIVALFPSLHPTRPHLETISPSRCRVSRLTTAPVKPDKEQADDGQPMAGRHLDRHLSTPPPSSSSFLAAAASASAGPTLRLLAAGAGVKPRTSRKEGKAGAKGGREKERSHWPSEASNLALGTKGGRRGAGGVAADAAGTAGRGKEGIGGVRIHASSRSRSLAVAPIQRELRKERVNK